MKIIDKTPFQNEQGQIDLMGRIQGTLKYGTTWYAELQAQKTVIAQLERLLEKGFVLIRNFNLPGSSIIVPLILVGTHGISVLYATHLKGFYEAKGDQWNKVDQGKSHPAPINLINRVVRLARATQVYMERQKITLVSTVEPVLIAADPGINIESMRPAARVVMSDAIKQFASSLLQNRSVLRPEQVFDLADRLVTPREPDPVPVPLPAQPASAGQAQDSASSRARAIFEAGESPEPFDPNELSFAFDEDAGAKPAAGAATAGRMETSPARPLAAQAGKAQRTMGMSTRQLAILGGIVVFECCLLAGALYIITQL